MSEPTNELLYRASHVCTLRVYSDKTPIKPAAMSHQYASDVVPQMREVIEKLAATLALATQRADSLLVINGDLALDAKRLEDECKAIEQRAEAAEAARDDWKQQAAVNAKAADDCLDKCVALEDERDALRQDAIRLDYLDALLTPESRIELAHYKCDDNKARGNFAQIIKLIDIEGREGDDTYGFGPSVRAALDAALAGQPTEEAST